MKKITSFLMMVALCCVSAFAQSVTTDLPIDKKIKVGSAQGEMVPNQWYFLYQNRGNGQFYNVGDVYASGGGFVYDTGVGNVICKSASSVSATMGSETGVNANNYLTHMVRFVPVEGEEGAFQIEFGSGTWFGVLPGSQQGGPRVITKNQFIAGEGGKYNFYIIKTDDEPDGNTLGRFGWNRYNFETPVDNDAPGGNHGGTLSAWGDNGEKMNALEGNSVWQIFDIVILGDVDLYEEAFNSLVANYNEIISREEGALIDNLLNGIGVGEEPGDFRPEYVEPFLAIHSKIDELIYACDIEETYAPLQAEFPNPEDVDSLTAQYEDAFNAVIENTVPYGMTNITPGYYTVNNLLNWITVNQDSTFYTQEEADAYNDSITVDSLKVAAGDFKGMVSDTIPQPTKGLCSRDSDGQGWLAWGDLQPKAEYLWKIEATSKPNEYKFTNMYRGTTFQSIATSKNAQLNPLDSAFVCFDLASDSAVVPNTGEVVTAVNIRSASQAANNFFYLHCGGHGAGKNKQGWIVGWETGGSTNWYLEPVDEATANEWMAAGDVTIQIGKKIAEVDSIIAQIPAQFEIAQDIETTIHENDSVVVSASQFYSQYTTEDAQTIPEGQTVYDFLLDGKQSTYWHSAWESGNQPAKKHYLQIEANETLEGLYAIKWQRRPVAADHLLEAIVKGYTEAPTDETTFEDGTELATLKFTFTNNKETLVSRTFDATGYNYLRIYEVETTNNRGYWHASALNVFKASEAKRYETTQADVRADLMAALQAQIEAWTAKEFSADSVELATDPTFQAAYDAFIAANEAWTAVYVDPAALRTAIANAPNDSLFVEGEDPGFWSEEVSIKAIVDEAAAYNNAGAYTPEASETHIAAIEKATADAFAAANPIETGKWYRIKFPTEAMYDEFGWDKVGADKKHHKASGEDTEPALFGKTLATGQNEYEYVDFMNDESEEDTVAVSSVTTSDELFDGHKLFFFEDGACNEGEDLFRFVEATDSTYLLQHKATGLFVHSAHPASTLSPIPSFFYVNAIGAGTNVIYSTDIFGKKTNPLHAQRDNNTLVAWNAYTLGSNSMMMIEEVEAVTEEPSTDFTKKLWPGKVNMFTYPVDITIGEGATAYGAEIVMGEDTAVVLKAIEAETISAGQPFILIADMESEEYITYADRKAEIDAEVVEEWGDFSHEARDEANIRIEEEYTQVSMSHGMEVDTVAHGMTQLVGTMKQVTVEAGKGLVAKEDGFAHTLVNTNVGAYSAYIKADFDAETEDVLGKLVIKIEGSIDTGINEVLNKVATSGNIYTVDGKLVGKGNINTVNNLPAGIYIVNGVKVVKN